MAKSGALARSKWRRRVLARRHLTLICVLGNHPEFSPCEGYRRPINATTVHRKGSTHPQTLTPVDGTPSSEFFGSDLPCRQPVLSRQAPVKGRPAAKLKCPYTVDLGAKGDIAMFTLVAMCELPGLIWTRTPSNSATSFSQRWRYWRKTESVLHCELLGSPGGHGLAKLSPKAFQLVFLRRHQASHRLSS